MGADLTLTTTTTIHSHIHFMAILEQHSLNFLGRVILLKHFLICKVNVLYNIAPQLYN